MPKRKTMIKMGQQIRKDVTQKGGRTLEETEDKEV
jgi:hypothetical protein